MTKPIVRDSICRRRRFDAEIVELCVRWYISYRLSYRDLVAMMAESGIVVSHTTILFKSFASAAITLAGIELAHRIRKRQFSVGRGRYRNFGSLKQLRGRALA
jgi:transposase-like protein